MVFIIAFNVLAVGFVLTMRRREQSRAFNAEAARRLSRSAWNERATQTLDSDPQDDAMLYHKWLARTVKPATAQS